MHPSYVSFLLTSVFAVSSLFARKPETSAELSTAGGTDATITSTKKPQMMQDDIHILLSPGIANQTYLRAPTAPRPSSLNSSCYASFDQMFIRVVEPIPTPVAYTHVIREVNTLLYMFAFFIETPRERSKYDWLDGHRPEILLTCLVQLEIFTFFGNDRFLLNLTVDEEALYRKLDLYVTQWFDPVTTISAERDLWKLVYQNLSSVEYMDFTGSKLKSFVLHVVQLLGEQYSGHDPAFEIKHPIPSIMSNETSRPARSPIFSVDYVLAHEYNRTDIAEWLNNFVVRKFFVHRYVTNVAESKRGVRFYRRWAELNFRKFDALRARFILRVAEEWKQVKCVYVHTVDAFAQRFPVEDWPDRVVRTLAHEMRNKTMEDEAFKVKWENRFWEFVKEDFKNWTMEYAEAFEHLFFEKRAFSFFPKK